MNVEDLRPVVEQQLALSRRLKARIHELEEAAHAPLAVVGIGLRFPGGIDTPAAYWSFLSGDRDAVTEIPADRTGLRSVFDPHRQRPGSSYVDRAGFLTDVAGFDAKFFGISAREAEALDPQQRLLLETSWEAMERAGIAIRRGDRLPVGVFVGIMASEYGQRRLGRDTRDIDPYFGTGGGHCFAAGRLSYVMGFSGPALSVDTACSSSLVALHLAAQSLRRRECRYAIVGGANLMFSGELMVSLCQSSALAPDGRSKAFTRDADGYGRGEGVASLVLMRQEEAEQEGRPVLAVLRGSATNHDGASSGLTVPNATAQQDVIRAALADARVAPGEIGYVEAHGTGTELGDPIEVGALDAVLGAGAPDRTARLAIGSVKSRIGHLEAAAGIAGVIKLVLALRHGTIPASLRASDGELSAMIAWERMPFDVPRAAQPWPDAYTHRLAGISAFGLSGTNAHAIFEAYDDRITAANATDAEQLVVISARDDAALAKIAALTAEILSACPTDAIAAVSHTLRAGRAAFACRRAVIGRDGKTLAALLIEAAARPGVSGMAPTRIELRIGSETDPERVVNAIADRFRLLAAEDCSDPAVQLHTMVKRIVPRLRLVRGNGRDVALCWDKTSYDLAGTTSDAPPRLLLAALAALFEAGADLRLDALSAPSTKFAPNLPTYPFRHECFWLPECMRAAEVPEAPTLWGATDDIATDTMPSQAEDADEVTLFIETELTALLRADGPPARSLSFLDAGGDSFIAMLLKKAIEQRYEVELPLDLLDGTMPLETLFAGISAHVRGAPVAAGAAE